MGWYRLKWSGSGKVQVEGSCESGNERLGSLSVGSSFAVAKKKKKKRPLKLCSAMKSQPVS
jgi:hypothetical protein